MFRCHNCGHDASHRAAVSEVFTVEGRRVAVEEIPADVCERCGEPAFAAETVERVRKLVHGEGHPMRTVTLDVFAFA